MAEVHTLPLNASNSRRDPRSMVVSSSLEEMPHLSQKICLLWGQGEFEPFVNRLIMDSRDGTRQGLPWEAAQELLFLAELSMTRRALHAAQITGLPFEKMLRQCLDSAEKNAQAEPRGALAWSDPRARSDVGRRDSARARATVPVNDARYSTKKSWWRRLVG